MTMLSNNNSNSNTNKLNLTEVDVSSIKLDESNPNEMTESQMQGLEKSMEKFGFLDPIHIDQNGNMIDGEHRYRTYQKFGKDKISAIIVNVKSKNELRLLRQAFNKLKGKHDFKKDLNEIHILMEDYSAKDLANLMGFTEQDLSYIIKQDAEAIESFMKSETAEKEQQPLDFSSISQRNSQPSSSSLSSIPQSQQGQQQEQYQQNPSSLTKCPNCGHEF